eukprot:1175358-Prorocentrum_minimum.AAC.4
MCTRERKSSTAPFSGKAGSNPNSSEIFSSPPAPKHAPPRRCVGARLGKWEEWGEWEEWEEWGAWGECPPAPHEAAAAGAPPRPPPPAAPALSSPHGGRPPLPVPTHTAPPQERGKRRTLN